jgi:hypothetical protein
MSIDYSGDLLPSVPLTSAANSSPYSLEQLHAASNQLWYEYWMLRCTARFASDDPAVTGAMEESFALHLRNLHRFLFGCETRADAMTAGDFLGERWPALRPALSPLLAEALVWSERTLGIPGFAELHAAGAPRFWTLVQASFELQSVMDTFISNLPRELLGSRWKVVYGGGLAV